MHAFLLQTTEEALGLDPTLTVTDWVSKLISNPIAQGRILKNPLAAGFPE